MGPSETQHRIGALTELPQVLRDLGQEPEEILADLAGIEPRVLRDPEGHLSFTEMGRLLEACVAATGCPHFGLLVGWRSGTASLGLVGRLMRSAPTLGDAIMDLCENQRRYVRGSVTYLLVQNGIAHWGYTLYQLPTSGGEQICEGALAVGANMLRELANVTPTAVQIARSAPRESNVYREVFGVPPQFDAEHYALCFPEQLLQRSLNGGDPRLRALLKRQVNNYHLVEAPGVAERVTRILHAHATLSDTSLQAVAEALGLHPRALNRRLLNEGTKFRVLRDHARLQVACQLLAGTKLSVTQIALALGYSEPSSFTHAFQRWSGCAPAKWREGVRPPLGQV